MGVFTLTEKRNPGTAGWATSSDQALPRAVGGVNIADRLREGLSITVSHNKIAGMERKSQLRANDEYGGY